MVVLYTQKNDSIMKKNVKNEYTFIEDLKNHYKEDEDISVNLFIKAKSTKTSNFVMFYQQVNFELIMLLKPKTCKLLLYFMAKCKYDNMIEIYQQTMMEDLKYSSVTTINNAIKDLKKLNIILSVKDTHDRRRNVYFLNPFQSWKGSAGNRAKYVAQQNKIDPQQLQLPFECKL